MVGTTRFELATSHVIDNAARTATSWGQTQHYGKHMIAEIQATPMKAAFATRSRSPSNRRRSAKGTREREFRMDCSLVPSIRSWAKYRSCFPFVESGCSGPVPRPIGDGCFIETRQRLWCSYYTGDWVLPSTDAPHLSLSAQLPGALPLDRTHENRLSPP
jgi:hypothetical protein